MTFGMKFRQLGVGASSVISIGSVTLGTNVAFGSISGAVGTYSSTTHGVEGYVCEHLGLRTRSVVHAGHLA